MADLTINPVNVVPVAGYGFNTGEIGEAINAGEWVYLKASDRKLWKADNTDEFKSSTKGMAISTGEVVGQRIAYQTSGDVAVGNILEPNEVYGISDNAGKIRPTTDNDSGDFQTPVAYAKTATVLSFMINALKTQSPS